MSMCPTALRMWKISPTSDFLIEEIRIHVPAQKKILSTFHWSKFKALISPPIATNTLNISSKNLAANQDITQVGNFS